jgi:hypothetical protein
MDFAKEVGQGHGAAWRGILFREKHKQLNDVVNKSLEWFIPIFGNKAVFNRSNAMYYWEWDTGEKLYFRHMDHKDEYYNYHGHEYPWIGWEELTNWATDECYKMMMTCNRSATKGVPKRIRATTNPYGPGHNWIKERFRLQGQWHKTIIITDAVDESGQVERPRCAIYGHIGENTKLLEADPTYMQTILSGATNPQMKKAWMMGSWDIVSGGMFGDVWDANVNIVEPFPLPAGWTLDRSFDWGSSAPFSVGWWARSDGSDIIRLGSRGQPIRTKTVRGDLFRFAEWYGCDGKPNKGINLLASEITKGIIQREIKWGIHGKVRPGPADTAIYTKQNGMSIAEDMAKFVRLGDNKLYRGIEWKKGHKPPNSRIPGWEQVRRVMANAKPDEYGIREHPGLFVFKNCVDFIRTVPVLPRDDNCPDDIPDGIEDHIADEVRYRVWNMSSSIRTKKVVGLL